MRFRKSVSLFLVSALFAQTLAPLAYAQQGGGDDEQQPVNPIVVVPTDPGDIIVPDTYTDLPVAHPGVGSTNADPGANYMWPQPMADFYNGIDFSQNPLPPDTWTGGGNGGGMQLGRPERPPVPWEGGGGSIIGGNELINPTPPSGGGGSGGGIISPPGTGGSGGGSGAGRGEISGQMNTHTGRMNLQVPVTSFTGPGGASVDLQLQLKALTPGWTTKVWTHSYDVRLDISTIAGKAVVTLPSGLSLPFVRTGVPGGHNQFTTYTGPMGVRATLTTTTMGFASLNWQNGDTWRFATPSTSLPFGTVPGFLYSIRNRTGGVVTIQRNGADVVIDAGGSRTATIITSGINLPANTQARFLTPTGIVDVKGGNNNQGEYPLDVEYAGGAKKFRLFYYNFTNQGVLPGGGVYSGPGGARFTGYQDSKQVAASSTLRYRYNYDSQGRVVSVVNPNQKVVSYQYVSDGQTKITNEDGKASWDYFSNGQYIGGKDEAGFTTVITRNAEHDVTQYRNERNQTWNITRDANGNALSTTNPLNQTTTFTYDSRGNVLTKTNPMGKTVTFSYEGNSIKTAYNALQQQVFSVNYDQWGQPSSVTDAGGRTSTMNYNADGDLISTTSPEGLTSTAVYNNAGLPTSATAPGNKTTTIQYDILLRVWKVTDPAGGQTQFTYDLNDNVTQVKDALNRTSNMSYDVLNQLTSSTNPRGDQELYTYTVLGQLKTVRNGRLKTRSYQYTDRGELKYMYLPDGTTEFYEYAGDGNVSAFRGSGRNKISYQYDNLGRLSVIDYPNMTDTTFTYDAAGRRISMTDTSGQTSWFYDTVGRLTSLNQAGKVTSYTYNIDGSRATMTQPAGTTTYTYDQYGRFKSLKNPFDEVTEIGYDALSRVSQKKQIAPNNQNPFTTEFFSYDTLDRLSVKSTMKISTNVQISAESYNYNAVSEVLSHTVDGETTSYGYDAASQLTSETRPGYSAGYTFDGNGNRLSKTVNGATEFYSYDDGDKLLSAGVKTYTYDLAGRTTSVKVGMGAPSVLTYDDEDRLKTFMGQTYTYNGFDTRVGKNGMTYHRDGTGVTAPLISDSGATYTPGVSERRNGVSTFLNAGLKDVAKQTDISGNVTATRKYDAYGMVIGSTGTWKGPFGYSGSAGYQEDETGLQLLGHRYYDSSTGRFITRDPIKDGRNWYAYCENNPINAVDADGLRCSGTGFALSIGIRNLGLRIQSSIFGFLIRTRLGQSVLGLFGVSAQSARDTLQRNAYTLQRSIAELADEAETAARGFRPYAANFAEQLAMRNARNGGGEVIMGRMSDPRYAGTHEKVQVIEEYVGFNEHGKRVLETINIHYFRNIKTGEGSIFKFKNDPISYGNDPFKFHTRGSSSSWKL
ncbi:MAG: RHS repeat-associated core domain-containing protein [Fimbriimonas sp.]|nr:RHS repeat-associated core domain-containing protein [Fimbriimonas sp.]